MGSWDNLKISCNINNDHNLELIVTSRTKTIGNVHFTLPELLRGTATNTTKPNQVVNTHHSDEPPIVNSNELRTVS